MGVCLVCSALVGVCLVCSALVGVCLVCSALVGVCLVCSALVGAWPARVTSRLRWPARVTSRLRWPARVTSRLRWPARVTSRLRWPARVTSRLRWPARVTSRLRWPARVTSRLRWPARVTSRPCCLVRPALVGSCFIGPTWTWPSVPSPGSTSAPPPSWILLCVSVWKPLLGGGLCYESGSHSLKLHITLGLHFPSCTALTHSRPPLHQSHSCHHSLINSDCLTTPAPHSLTHIKAAHKHSPTAKSCFALATFLSVLPRICYLSVCDPGLPDLRSLNLWPRPLPGIVYVSALPLIFLLCPLTIACVILPLSNKYILLHLDPLPLTSPYIGVIFFSFAGRCALSATVNRTFFITWICKELQLSKNKSSCEIRLLALWLVIFVGVHQHMHLQMCIFHYFAYGTYNAADSWKSSLERMVPYDCISMASTKLTTSRGKPANNSSRINKT